MSFKWSILRPAALVLLLVWPLTKVVAQPQPIATSSLLKQQLQQAQHDTTRLRLCVSICQQYRDQNRFDSLYVYLQQGMHLLNRAPSIVYASDLHYFLAMYRRQHSLYRQAILPIKQAISLAQQAKSVKRITKYQYALAVIYSDAGQFAEAVSQITTNLNYLRDHEDKQQLTSNYLLIIDLFAELKNEPMRELYVNRFTQLANYSSLTGDQSYAYVFKAELVEEQGYHKQAAALYEKSLQYAYLAHNKTYITDVLNRQGASFRNHGQYQVAIRSFNKAFAMAQSIHDLFSMAVAKRELAITFLAAGRKRAALREAKHALKLSRQNKTVISIMASLECLANILKANGFYREALTTYLEYQQAKEKKFTEANMQQIAQMQAQFESENKEKTIKILQKNAQINQLKVVRQEQQLTISRQSQLTNAIIICLLLILTGVIFYFLHKSRRSYLLLHQTTQELAETNLVKDKLFSIISHDLRSPLASMKTTLYQSRQDNDPTLIPFVNRLDRQVDTVLNLLTNLLDWSIIQLKGIELIQEPLVLRDSIDETISLASDLIEQKQLGLINQVEKTHVVLANKHQLRAVIRNLLNNAIKFTPINGYIRLQSIKKEHFIELTVRDSGVGMSSEQLATLFSNPEVRAGTAGEAGSGIGLRISKELVERLGGTLAVESWPQKGTLVRLQLKACPDQVSS